MKDKKHNSIFGLTKDDTLLIEDKHYILTKEAVERRPRVGRVAVRTFKEVETLKVSKFMRDLPLVLESTIEGRDYYRLR